MNIDHGTPSHALSGAHRSLGRRSTRSNRPYGRPLNGAATVTPAMLGGNGMMMATPPRSSSAYRASGSATLPRGGGDGFMSGIKSMFTRPLAWLATPSKEPAPSSSTSPLAAAHKRDASYDVDPEDPSPSRQRASKRARRASPAKIAGPYDPVPDSVGDFAALPSLPQLPANVSLSARRQTLPANTSSSMAYLDPPRTLLAPSSPSARPRRNTPRAGRVDHFVTEEAGPVHSTPVKAAPAADAWSPWKEGRSMSRRQSVLPSMSPFHPAASLGPSARAVSGLSGLGRSATLSNLAREASVGAGSDVSMHSGRNSHTLRGSSTALRLDRIANDDEDISMRSDSQWARRRTSLAPSASPAVSRLMARPAAASAASGASNTPTRIRKGQMVWDADKGFVRASEFEAEVPKPLHQNDAERILAALESMRRPQLIDATSSRPATGLPANLVGSSSRTLRKAIAVPLATAQADNAKRGKRHGSEWLGENTVSAMISPYGRRRAIDHVVKEERRERRRRAESEASEMEMDASSRGGSRASRSYSRSAASDAYLSDDQMSVSRASSAKSASPQPASRRSARIKAKSPMPEETPKAIRRSTRKRSSTKSPEPVARTTRARARKQTSPLPEERETTPEPAFPVPMLTTTAPSPHTGADGYQVRDDDGPRVRSSLRAGAERKHRSHQGAASYNSSRATTPGGGAPGRFSARDEDLPEMDELEAAKIPLTSFKGISMNLFGAAPVEKKMDEEKEKESTPPLLSSRISAPPPAPAPPATTSLSIPASNAGRSSLGRGLGSGLSTRPRASSPLAANSITAEPDSPQAHKMLPVTAAPPKSPVGGFFGLGAAPATMPSLTAPTGTTTPVSKPPVASSFFAPPTVLGGGDIVTKSPSPIEAPSGGIPSFFGGGAATPPVPAPKPVALDFGVSAPAPSTAAGGSTFSFGSSSAATAPSAPLFGAKPAEPAAPKAPFSFGGTSSPAPEAPKAPFSFGGTSTPTGDKPAEASAAPFSFGGAATPTADKPAEAPKAPFSFGSTSTPVAKPAETPAAPPFSFGAKPAEAPKAAAPFSFGGSPAPADKPADKPAFGFGANGNGSAAADKPAAGGFSFGGASTTPAPAAPPATGSSFGTGSGFSFGKAADKPSTPTGAGGGGFGTNGTSTPGGFSFGASSTPAGNGSAGKPAPGGFSFGASPTTPAAPASSTGGFGFGAPSSTPAAAPTGSGFGAPANNATSTPGSFTFGKPSTGGFGSTPAPAPSAPAPSFSFGASSSTPAAATGSTGGFGTGSGFGNTSSTPAATGGFGTSTPAASGGFGAGPGFGSGPGFGAGATTSSPSTFSFGATNNASGPSTPTSANASGSFSFGSAPASSNTTPSFSFGAAAANTTAAATQSFQFGAAAAAPGGAPAPQRFGSPAPAAGVEGFSLGVTADMPASPGGRKIKPLRRGTVKR